MKQSYTFRLKSNLATSRENLSNSKSERRFCRFTRASDEVPSWALALLQIADEDEEGAEQRGAEDHDGRQRVPLVHAPPARPPRLRRRQ